MAASTAPDGQGRSRSALAGARAGVARRVFGVHPGADLPRLAHDFEQATRRIGAPTCLASLATLH